MSQVITSTAMQKGTIVVDSSVQLVDPKEQDGAVATIPSPDKPPPPPPLPSLSTLRRLPAPEAMANNAAAHQAVPESEKPLEIVTDASNSDKVESVTNDEGFANEGGPEDHMCVCAPPVQRVPRPANCKFQCALPPCRPAIRRFLASPYLACFLVSFSSPRYLCNLTFAISTNLQAHHGWHFPSLSALQLRDPLTMLTIDMQAFILYRSRMHTQVAHENPGLPNPRISQILGDRWAKETPEVKAQWKAMSMEESKRHSQQYPNYKYQPRRRGSKALASYQPDEEASKCGKCNGRYYKGHHTPSLPLPNGKAKIEQQIYPTPTSAGSMSEEAYRTRFEPTTSSTRASGPAIEPKPISPSAKRQRLAEAVESREIAPIQVNPYSRMKPGYAVRTLTPTSGLYHAAHGLDSPLPHISGMVRLQGGAMPPPLRPDVAAGWPAPRYPQSRRPGMAEESLRLPPLQTAIPSPSPAAREADARYSYTPIHSAMAASNIKHLPPHEQIMSIQLPKKLALLSKICPPLPCSHQISGAFPQGRGPIIAVEGPNDSLVREVGRSVEKALLVAPKDIAHIALEVWHNDLPKDIPNHDQVRSDGDAAIVELLDVIPSIFQCIVDWHAKSKMMSRHVQGGEDNFGTVVHNTDRPKSIRSSGNNNDRDNDNDNDNKKLSLPVALIQGGFSLTISDRFSCCTSHSVSNYAAVEHWQWMATLWRGITGADLVVYVEPSTEEEMSKGKNVELLEKKNAITVRLTPSRGLDEATERRLSFEVIEWMRLGWIQDGRPRSS